jgi:hypothetical protein
MTAHVHVSVARNRHRVGMTRLLLTAVVLAVLVIRVSAQGVRLTSISPASASFGESVTVTGTGFGGPGVDVRVGGVVAPVVSATGSRVVFRVPVGVPVGPATVTVTNPGRRTASGPFEVSGQVSVTFDETHRIESIVGPDGGVVTTSSNGRTFSLTIPPGALSTPESIVMTPVAEILGFPLERPLGIVHFAPEGLQFLVPATLTITLPAGVDTRGVIGISAAGNGDNLHLTPFKVIAAGQLSVSIPHFTLGGLGAGTLGTINSIFCLAPTIECRYVNALAQASNAAQQTICGRACTEDDWLFNGDAISDAVGAAYMPLLDQWFGELGTLLNTTARTSDDGLRLGRREFLAWRAFVQASSCSSTVDCDDVPAIMTNDADGTWALAAAYVATLQRAEDGCNDWRVFNLEMEVAELDLWGRNGLPPDFDEMREQFGCQLVVTTSFPETVEYGDAAPFSATVGIRGVGGSGYTLRPGLEATLDVLGCGVFPGSVRRISATTDGSGTLSATVNVGLPCDTFDDRVQIRVSFPPTITDLTNQFEALGRTTIVRATIGVEVAVSPQNATISPGETLTFTAAVTGASDLVRWTATGGTITPGPSATATYTAGSTPGIFSVTATSNEVPSKSQTVAVTVEDSGDPEIIIRNQTAELTTAAAGQCVVNYDPFFGKDTVCPGGRVAAPDNFTYFFEQRMQHGNMTDPYTGGYITNGAFAEHYALIDDDEIISSGLTGAGVGGQSGWDQNGEPYEYYPVSHAQGSAEFRVEIQVRGEPAEYLLEGRFFHDNYEGTVLGHARVKIQFADQNIDSSNSAAGDTRFTKRGTLQPGTYVLIFTTDSESLKYGNGGGSFHTRWSFRLRINQ